MLPSLRASELIGYCIYEFHLIMEAAQKDSGDVAEGTTPKCGATSVNKCLRAHLATKPR